MKSGKDLRNNVSANWVAGAVGLLACVATAFGEEVQHLSVIQQGGMPGRPIVTGIEPVTNGVKVTWDGPSGYYQLFQKSNLNASSWQRVGGPNSSRQLTLTNVHGTAFFRVSGPSANYAGAQACVECHENVHTEESFTRHADAFTDPRFVAKGGQTNSACLPCHTVGYGLPTGFVSKNDPNTNPRLAGVQCESCHGPAANHAANENDISVRPRAEIASTVCGGCHNKVSHRPHYEEWSRSGHAIVTEDMNPAGRINSCGRCHSGSSRLALLKGENPSITVTNDANVSITCVVCHDPHAQHVWTNGVTGIVYTNQLRNPLSSTNDFFLATSDNFTNKYNANINLCAQCHNHRGASWTRSSRPPHHSPQYNMLLATVGLVPTNYTAAPAAHAGTKFLTDPAGQKYIVTNQCVTCHVQSKPHVAGPPEILGETGHKFTVETYDACADCHGTAENARGLVVLVQTVVSNQIQLVKARLDQWALQKAAAPIQKYGKLAWEYDFAGELSSPDGTLRGPVSSTDPQVDEQKHIPDNIKKARFNLYLVAYDGSYGVHHPFYSLDLLSIANGWVLAELNP